MIEHLYRCNLCLERIDATTACDIVGASIRRSNKGWEFAPEAASAAEIHLCPKCLAALKTLFSKIETL